MKVGYLDALNGAAGDMLVAAALDAGADFERLRADLARLDLGPLAIRVEKRQEHGLLATRFIVEAPEDQPERHLRDVLAILVRSGLERSLVARASKVFHRLAVAEARVHGTTPDEVHFHEVGAVDAIVDVVAFVLALDQLGIERLASSPLPLGSGTVTCAHGIMPVPVPAVVALLEGLPTTDNGEEGELVTPTGAALLATLAEDWGRRPAMRLLASGTGAGTRTGRRLPNVCRLLIGETDPVSATPPESPGTARPERDEELAVLETNVDDQNPQFYSYLTERLLEAGAIDVFMSAIVMKQGRPGVKLTVLAPPACRQACEELILTETTSLGVRSYAVRRRALAREIVTLETDFGPIRVKVARHLGQVASVSPEYRDCVAAARAKAIPLKQVWQAALAKALETPLLEG
ncbi:MAG: nickel pincer cofactor biosynthesis protein LarC [Candidatus Sericytochromatia bacterium]|nr:nickel pincer cofactor biosynthesis protein LarC [Candidatus Sericytochromatia bacterium]